ncbi:MAG: phosphoribosyl-AMP cyclohydrolase [Gammaproteobacteria bacterium]|nr:phosphoribosyl-AMP cyclohydrolase [Gammaproteobacteria bacterium]|tara:strand:+ start:1013 stop:1468 length:456 start_codon:yes stop_codon:yes gene_type:complete
MFEERKSVKEVEEGNSLSPKFSNDGFIPVVTTDADSGVLLMHAYMNKEALELTIKKGEAHYFSRSRNCIWHKGSTSGFVQKVINILIDDDQDCIWLKVKVTGNASCHVGYYSCFYREIKYDGTKAKLKFTEKEKVFDPDDVYGDSPNPTIL